MKIAYYIVKSLLSLMMLASATTYLTSGGDVAAEFTSLGFPTWLITPLAIAKILGVVAIWDLLKFDGAKRIRDFAYAGFAFNFLIAGTAHFQVGDGEYLPAFAALVFLISTVVLRCKLDAKAADKPDCCS